MNSTMNGYVDAAPSAIKRRIHDDNNGIHFKEEPVFEEHILNFNSPNTSQHQFAYHGNGTFTEQELAESLGWSHYGTTTQSLSATNATPNTLQQDLHMQNLAIQNQRQMMALPHTNSNPVGLSNYGSVAIPQHSGSPAGWHSSLDSTGFLGESSSASRPFSLGNLANTQGFSIRKDVASVAEKKAMRRYSHNAVERRRRDNINEQIQELAALVPNSLLGLNASIQSPRTDNGVPTTAPQKPNKGMVLRKSVEYIQMLKSLLEEKTEREQLMEIEIRRLGGHIPPEKKQTMSSSWLDEFAIVEDDV